MSVHADRARILLSQQRYKEALDQLKQAIVSDPEDPDVHFLLGSVHLGLHNVTAARESAQTLMRLMPADAFSHYLMCRIEDYDDNTESALEFIKNAILLAPDNAAFRGIEAHLWFTKLNFERALECADAGLQLDPTEVNCLNIRASALIKLNRKEEAFETMDRVLEENPEDAHSHTSVGWNHLEKGDHRKALYHFKEALALNPNSAYAKQGMVEALKAKSFIYRGFLKYAFWMSNLGRQKQMAIIIGGWFAAQILSKLANNIPALSPYVWPLIGIYALFAISSWVVNPLSDMFLRLNRFSKHALTKLEYHMAEITAIMALFTVIGLVGYLISLDILFASIGAFGFTMLIPISAILSAEKEKVKTMMIAAAVMASFGIGSMLYCFKSGADISTMAVVYFLGVFGIQMLSNFWAK